MCSGAAESDVDCRPTIRARPHLQANTSYNGGQGFDPSLSTDSFSDSSHPPTLNLKPPPGNSVTVCPGPTTCPSDYTSMPQCVEDEAPSGTSNSKECSLPTGDDHTYRLPHCCALGQCSLKEITGREFSSFTRRGDAQNLSSGDVDLCRGKRFSASPLQSTCVDREKHKDGTNKAFLFHSSEKAEDKVCNMYYGVQLDGKCGYSEFHEMRDQQLKDHSTSYHPNNKISFLCSHLTVDNSVAGKPSNQSAAEARAFSGTHSPSGRLVCASRDVAMDRNLDYRPRPWVSNTLLASPTHPKISQEEQKLYEVQDECSDNGGSTYGANCAPLFPHVDRPYCHTPCLKPTFSVEKSSSSSVDKVLTDVGSPSSFTNAEVSKAYELSRSYQDPMSSRSYLAQLLQAPLPTLGKRSLENPAQFLTSPTNSETSSHSAGFPESSQTYSHRMIQDQLPHRAHICDTPEGLKRSSSTSCCKAELEQPQSPESVSSFKSGVTDDQVIPTEKRIKTGQRTEQYHSDADGLSTFCDLYRDAQGAVDMTFESLTLASSGRRENLFHDCPSYSQCKMRYPSAEESSVSSVTNTFSCISPALDSLATPDTRLSMAGPITRPETPVDLLLQCMSTNNQHSSGRQLTTENPCSFQWDNATQTMTPSDSQNVCNQTKSVLAPVLKQRYLPQSVAPAAHSTARTTAGSHPVICNDKHHFQPRSSNSKRPFCQHNSTHKWKMRRLVLSGH